MAKEGDLAVFLAEFDHQVEQIEKVYSILTEKLSKWGSGDVNAELVESAGYWLHNLYCAFEDLFKLICGFFENQISSDGAFHVSLLRRMIVRIEGVRPAVLSLESYRGLDELRGFRHVFRHAYSLGLDDERVLFLIRRVLAHKETVMQDLGDFRQTTRSYAE